MFSLYNASDSAVAAVLIHCVHVYKYHIKCIPYIDVMRAVILQCAFVRTHMETILKFERFE